MEDDPEHGAPATGHRAHAVAQPDAVVGRSCPLLDQPETVVDDIAASLDA